MLCTNYNMSDVSFSSLDLTILYIARLLDQFKATLQQWKTWDDIEIIQSHQSIKDHLWGMFQRGLKVQVRL